MKVHSLYIYPVKSCSSVPVNSCELGEFGFKYDRFWVIAEFRNDKWAMITQREISQMVLIVPKVIVEGDSTTLVLNAPGMSELVVPLAYNHDSVDIIVWKDIVTGTSQGAEAAAWFSQYIGKPVQLFAKDKRRIRTLNQKHTPSIELFAHQPQTAFADGFPFLILSTASVEKFAEGLPEHPFQITPKSFRPNIVIEVPEPFDEETFIKVKVGNVPFVIAARSARCIMTNNNPETGIPDPNVFKHAMRTRRIDPGKKYDACMGMNAIALVDTGKIAVGDKIEVMEKGTHNLKGIWHGNSHPIDPDTIKIFLSEATGGIILSTMLTYIESTGTKSPNLMIAISISIFSFGRLCATLPFCIMVGTLNSTRFVLICATLISIVGNAFYACAGYLDKSISLFIIILSRFILGFGSGTLGVTRSFVEKASSKDEKVQNINLSVLSQYAGFTLSPLFSEAVMHFATFEVNLHASLHGIIMICLNLLLLLLLFQLPAVDKFNKKDVLANEEETFGMITHHIHKEKGTVCKDFTNSEYYCFILIILVNFVFRGTLGVMETSMSASMFKLSGNSTPETVIKTCNKLFIGIGVLGITVFSFIPTITELFSSLIFGVLSFSMGTVLVSPFVDSTSAVLFVVGSILIWSIGSPVTQVLTISTYSKLIGTKPSPLAMGWLTSAGSLGRIMMPLIAGANQAVSSAVILVCWSMILVGIISFKTLLVK